MNEFGKIFYSFCSKLIGVGSLVSLGIFYLPLTGNAQDLLSATQDTTVEACIPCHLNPGMQLQYRDGNNRFHRLFIDPDGFSESIHYRKGMTYCTKCHAGVFSTNPHEVTKRPQCLDCHDDIISEYKAIGVMTKESVHFKSGEDGFDCGTCHSPHTMRPAREMSVEMKNRACVECHEREYNPSGLSLERRHNWHPQAALHLDLIACISCHTKPEGDDFSFRHRILAKEFATSDCYDCHSKESKMSHYIGSFGDGRAQPLKKSDLVNEYYISGAIRYRWLDIGGLTLMALVFLGIIAHGTLRIISARRNRH